VDVVQPGIVKLTQGILKRNPKIAGILLECTELPPYSDALRAYTGLPVWDAITAADFYINAYKDNPRFGLNDWQAEWDGVQDDYFFGDNLIEADRKELVNKIEKPKPKPKAKSKAVMEKIKKKIVKQQSPTLGIIRLDYNYPPAAGDIDSPASYDYDILFRAVPGLTFEMAQSGKMTYAVQKEFEDALLNHCGFDVDDTRFVIYGCQDVPGFDAVAKGEKVEVEYVTPGIVKKVKEILSTVPTIRAILLECTELPPYSDALRKEFGLPVFDAITCTDFFVSARKDNPRFGLNQWQNDWDGIQDDYEYGQNLTDAQRAKMINL